MAACNCTGACRYGGGCAALGPRIGEYARHSPFKPWETVTIDPFKPHDDPQSPRPSPLAGAWQCPGCGRIYSMFVNSCDCQMYRFVTSGNTTNVKFYPAPPSEMP